MRITLNGEPRDLPEAMTVAALLAHLDIDPRVVAVELDRVVVKRARFGDTPVPEGAEVEIVAFVGGGGYDGSASPRLDDGGPINRARRLADAAGAGSRRRAVSRS